MGLRIREFELNPADSCCFPGLVRSGSYPHICLTEFKAASNIGYVIYTLLLFLYFIP
jgi:hypothetical protein